MEHQALLLSEYLGQQTQRALAQGQERVVGQVLKCAQVGGVAEPAADAYSNDPEPSSHGERLVMHKNRCRKGLIHARQIAAPSNYLGLAWSEIGDAVNHLNRDSFRRIIQFRARVGFPSESLP